MSKSKGRSSPVQPISDSASKTGDPSGRETSPTPARASGFFATRSVVVLIIGCIALAAAWPAWNRASWSLKTGNVRNLLANGSSEEAYQAAKKLESNPQDPGEAAFLIGVAARRTDRLQESLTHLERASRGGFSASQIERQQMMALFQGTDITKSEPYLEKLTTQPQSDPEAEEIYECLVKGWLQQHRLEDARRILGLWTSWKPQAIPPRLWLAQIDQQMFLYGAADEGYRSILKIDPQHRVARLMLAANLFRDGKAEEALQLYQGAGAEKSADPVVWLGMAQCYLRLGETAKAKELLERAAAKEVSSRDRGLAMGELAKLLFAEKKYPETVALLEEAIPFLPRDSGAYSLLAQAYSKVGKKELAQTALKKSEQLLTDNAALTGALEEVQKHPQDPLLRVQVAELTRRMGDTQDELRWLITAVRMDAQCLEAHQQLARYYGEHDQPEMSTRHQVYAEKIKLASGSKIKSPPRDK